MLCVIYIIILIILLISFFCYDMLYVLLYALIFFSFVRGEGWAYATSLTPPLYYYYFLRIITLSFVDNCRTMD
jgi:hypothetical protein